MDLTSKVALVTGAVSGIGRATALKLAEAGACVGLLSHTRDEIEDAAVEIAKAGGESVVLVADVSDAEQMEQAVKDLIGAAGRLDIVVANAGINGVWPRLTI